MPSVPSSTIGGPDRQVTVHAAHSGRLPPVLPYVRDVWQRRRFVLHLARSNLKAAHTDTVFGQLWQVLNPLMLGLVYFLIVSVIRGSGDADYLVHLIGAIFLFFWLRRALGAGANSIVSGGGLMLNSAFPRAILPLATSLASTLNYLPTFMVYLAFHAYGGFQNGNGLDLHPTMLLLPLLWLPLAVFIFGMSMLVATLTVYFRDTAAFLPYVTRIWMYLSPVLLTYDEIIEMSSVALNGGGRFQQVPDATVELASQLIYLNPMMGFLRTWEALVNGALPQPLAVGAALFWTVASVVAGGYFFLTREREFAFRV